MHRQTCKHRHTSAVRGIPHCRSHGPGHRGYTFSIRQIGVIPQQQDPFAARHGPAAHRGVRGRSAGRHRCIAVAARSGPQDSQRHSVGSVRQIGHGGRHPRIQSQRTHRTHHRKQIAACHGAMSCEAYTGRSDRKAHHWLILHGRYVCKARRPLCLECGIREWCRHWSKNRES